MSDSEQKGPVAPPSAHIISFPSALLAGAIAGFSVDVSLYPLDTLKTRLQSPEGFLKSGGFRGIYKGLGVAALGSAPGAALFFSSYETSKRMLGGTVLPAPAIHMLAASTAEVVACLVRVPTEVIKQRYQANLFGSRSLADSIGSVFRAEGIRGFYHGYGITIMREIPFSLIQFPLYEAWKDWIYCSILDKKRDLLAYEAALCGSISGGIAAGLTTPLDVAKTRLMLGKDINGVAYKGVGDTFTRLLEESRTPLAAGGQARGIYRVFFAGVEPRVAWISIGGFVFFGAYEQALKLIASR